MYKKVLVIEDLDSVGYGITKKLEQELQVPKVVLSQYGDDAYLKFQRAVHENAPFDLLITDLSLNPDHREVHLGSGKAFIKKIRELGHTTPIIVCSVEDKPTAIKKLMHDHQVSGYVLKGRNGLKHLVEAVKTVKSGQPYLSPGLSHALRTNAVFEVQEYDITLLSLLSNGFTQDQISLDFVAKGISPSSLSSIEKRLNRLKDELRAKNTIQLVANAKDLGLI